MGWKKRGLNITFVTLLFDLVFIAYIISMSGGLKSAVMLAQVLFTIFFALLFPRPLTILPPLLLLPIIASIDRYFMHQDNDFVVALFFFTWYLAINLIVVYMIVYLNHTEDKQQRNILRLQEKLGDKAVLEERTRLAREIHDGLGASLSSLIIQSEYIINLNQDIKLKEELVELKSTAEESIEELRRSLQMMRDQFDLIPALQDYCNTFQVRTKIDIAMEAEGKPWNLAAEVQLCIFRILQESLTNINKHAKANKINITLFFGPSRMILSIRDNGRGFEQNVKMQHHYGLITMGERARKVDGELKIKSIPQEGTTIIFSLEKGSPKWPKLK